MDKQLRHFLEKPILKNFPKFNNIKLALGVNLGELKTVIRPEFDYYNVSTLTYGRKWFLLKGQKVLFKTLRQLFKRNKKHKNCKRTCLL